MEKVESINHVAKRLCTALRKLSTESKKWGVTFGGRGKGKLTQPVITKLTAYYGTAIRAHPHDLCAMTDAVFATLHHAVSTDLKPQHDRCPDGDGSWCFYKKNVGTPLSAEVALYVKDIYGRLGHPDFLRRCLRGATQNNNEGLNSKIWANCPKTGFVGLEGGLCCVLCHCGVQQWHGTINAESVCSYGHCIRCTASDISQ